MRSFISIALAAAIPALVSAANLTVNVGANGLLAYDPPSMNASIGDMVTFVFQSKNHSVYTSSFTDPCTYSGVFNSSFFPVNGSNGPFPSFMINITQTAPIWFYCAQTSPVSHCQAGMVGVINPTADKTFAAFQAAAMGNSTNATSNSGASNSGGSTGSPTGSAAPSATSAHSNSAIRLSGGTALLTLVSVVAGITAL